MTRRDLEPTAPAAAIMSAAGQGRQATRRQMAAGTDGTTSNNYAWAGLRADLVAGLTVAAVALPQAMAYALIAGVDPIYGLYTAIVMTALGSIFGSSAHLIN